MPWARQPAESPVVGALGQSEWLSPCPPQANLTLKARWRQPVPSEVFPGFFHAAGLSVPRVTSPVPPLVPSLPQLGYSLREKQREKQREAPYVAQRDVLLHVAPRRMSWQAWPLWRQPSRASPGVLPRNAAQAHDWRPPARRRSPHHPRNAAGVRPVWNALPSR